jgi:hypothetical protein
LDLNTRRSLGSVTLLRLQIIKINRASLINTFQGAPFINPPPLIIVTFGVTKYAVFILSALDAIVVTFAAIVVSASGADMVISVVVVSMSHLAALMVIRSIVAVLSVSISLSDDRIVDVPNAVVVSCVVDAGFEIDRPIDLIDSINRFDFDLDRSIRAASRSISYRFDRRCHMHRGCLG